MSQVSQARLYKISQRYLKNKKIADRVSREDPTPVPQDEYEIEQILTTTTENGTKFALIAWVGYEEVNWVEYETLPSPIKALYTNEGRVSLEEYIALIQHLERNQEGNEVDSDSEASEEY
jgi:hypothetical protein